MSVTPPAGRASASPCHWATDPGFSRGAAGYDPKDKAAGSPRLSETLGALTTDQFLPAPHDHVVQFYGHDDELADSVGPYIAETIESGGTAIVIATPVHRLAFAARMVEAGIDVARAEADGTLLILDAAEAMAGLLVDGRLAPHRFDKLIGDVVRDATAGGRPVRAFGEIVALLWRDGYIAAALELEALWNDLGREAGFSLYCAYPLESVEGEGDVDAFHEVCAHHSAVVGAPVALPRLQDAPLELARTFIRGGRGPADSRRFVTETLVAWGRADLVDDAAVIASELATNAEVHARTDFTVTISRRPDGAIRVAVRDASLVPPQPRHPAVDDGSGRGLGLVEAMAAGWGADLFPDGKVVWAQLGR
jgi:hypothetical protein